MSSPNTTAKKNSNTSTTKSNHTTNKKNHDTVTKHSQASNNIESKYNRNSKAIQTIIALRLIRALVILAFNTSSSSARTTSNNSHRIN
eukprot:6090173-Pyramimonas_sp.AAC.1